MKNIKPKEGKQKWDEENEEKQKKATIQRTNDKRRTGKGIKKSKSCSFERQRRQEKGLGKRN